VNTRIIYYKRDSIYLLDNGADPNISERDSNFQTTLTYCGFHQGLGLMKLLIEYGADPYFGKLYTTNAGSYLFTPYRAYFNNKNFDKLIYLITEYHVDPFEVHKALIFNAGKLTYSDGNFFDYFLKNIPKDKKRRFEIIEQIYPDLVDYKFQKYIIDTYGILGINQIIEIGVNYRILNEYSDVSAMINSDKYNL
jgi:ankyrin repeat protein